MQLYVNNDLIDFNIEHEVTLIEVVEGLEKEFQKSSGHILSIAVNGEMISEENESWQEIPLKQIETLHIEADTQEIAHIKLLQTILEYLNVIEDACLRNTYPQGFDIDDVKQILNSIDFLCSGEKADYKPLQVLLSYIFNMIGIFNLEEKQKLETHKDLDIIFTHIRNMILFRTILLLESDTQWVSLNKHVKKIIEQSYIKIVNLFINAQEDLAIQFIISSNDAFIQWLHFLHQPPSSVKKSEQVNTWLDSHRSIHNSLTPFFEELSSAMEVEDWITVGDLIEYEISPQLLQYIETMEQFYPVEA